MRRLRKCKRKDVVVFKIDLEEAYNHRDLAFLFCIGKARFWGGAEKMDEGVT